MALGQNAARREFFFIAVSLTSQLTRIVFLLPAVTLNSKKAFVVTGNRYNCRDTPNIKHKAYKK